MVAHRPFRFAVQCLPYGEREHLVTTARRAEAVGVEELYTADHLGSPDPFIPLMVAAEATDRLRVGPLVLNNEFHHPALLARTVATADVMTGGRVVLGMGTGYMQAEHDAASIELRPPGRRVDRFEESLTVIRSLLDDGSASFSGDHHVVEIDDLGIRPAQDHVPFLIGGHGPRVVGLAARHADIFQFTGLVHGEGGQPGSGGFPIEQVRDRARVFDEAAGDRIADIERSALVQMTVVGSEAESRMAEAVERTGFDRSVLEETPFMLLGSIEQIVDKMERLREDVGISHYVIRDLDEFEPIIERLAGR